MNVSLCVTCYSNKLYKSVQYKIESLYIFYFQSFVNTQHYPGFLETAVPIFLQLLKEGTVIVKFETAVSVRD